MKKILCMLLALLMLFALCACGQSAAPAAEKQKLIVGFDAEFPPFGYIAEDGSYDGFDLAMAAALCERLGWDFEAVAIDWNAKDAELSSGNINCIWNGFTYTGREEDYTWSDPYVDNSIVLVVKADSGIASLEDLAGRSVMAQAASSAVDAIASNEAFAASLGEVVELADYNTGFMELKQGTVDAVAAMISLGGTLEDLASFEHCYAPLFSTAKDVVNMAALVGLNVLHGAVKQVHLSDIRPLVESGAYIVDVREEREFAAGHIKGAHNVPLSQLHQRLGEIPKDRPVYLHCRTSQRSYYAYRTLTLNGYDNVTNLSGSFLGLCLEEYFNDVTTGREPIVTAYNFR